MTESFGDFLDRIGVEPLEPWQKDVVEAVLQGGLIIPPEVLRNRARRQAKEDELIRSSLIAAALGQDTYIACATEEEAQRLFEKASRRWTLGRFELDSTGPNHGVRVFVDVPTDPPSSDDHNSDS